MVNSGIRSDVVQSDIPLLCSPRSAMKTAGVKLNLENGIANIFRKEITLNLTTSGHYIVPMKNKERINYHDIIDTKRGGYKHSEQN